MLRVPKTPTRSLRNAKKPMKFFLDKMHVFSWFFQKLSKILTLILK